MQQNTDTKKKILFVGEFSGLTTGYSTYYRELLTRLYRTQRYEVAEFGCLGSVEAARAAGIPWKYYSNLPDNNDAKEVAIYKSKVTNVYGEWKFEQVCLQFCPDIVVTIRDWHMDEFIERSAFRDKFRWAMLFPVDCTPLHPQWLATLNQADAVFAYCEWGYKEMLGVKNLMGVASPGADLTHFSPVQDKQSHRERMGLQGNSLIIGTVMRNQKRKLFPDLMQSFRRILEESPASVAKRLYLYMHTTYPDYFELPELMCEYGISSRCLFTYKCQSCGYVFASLFQGARGICPKCNQMNSFFPSTNLGLTREELSSVYNLFDIHVQYAVAEGFGLPLVEAAACEIPVMAVDFSAMSDVVRKLKGTPLKILKLHRDADVNAYRAIPDNNHFISQVIKFFELAEDYRTKKGEESRRALMQNFNWDETARVWTKYFDEENIVGEWNSPANLHQYPQEIPPNLSPEDYVTYIVTNVLGKPELCTSYLALRLLRDIQLGISPQGINGGYYNESSALGIRPDREKFTRENALHYLKNIRDYYNMWERKRCQTLLPNAML